MADPKGPHMASKVQRPAARRAHCCTPFRPLPGAGGWACRCMVSLASLVIRFCAYYTAQPPPAPEAHPQNVHVHSPLKVGLLHRVLQIDVFEHPIPESHRPQGGGGSRANPLLASCADESSEPRTGSRSSGESSEPRTGSRSSPTRPARQRSAATAGSDGLPPTMQRSLSVRGSVSAAARLRQVTAR
jgi:hypothetical protein